MNVRDIMVSPVVTVGPDANVDMVVRIMVEHHLSGLPVVDLDGHLLGMVTERDVVAKHAQVHLPTYVGFLGGVFPFGQHRTEEELRHVTAVTAAQLMSDDVRTVSPETPVDEAASIMVEEDANPLPVMEGTVLAGIISHADIMTLLLREEEEPGGPAQA